MNVLKIIAWSVLCLGAGAYLGGKELFGKTPAQHVEATLKKAPPMDRVKEGAEDLVDEVKRRVTIDQRPVERHSDTDKAALEKLIAKRPHR